jgi:salicylate hydroxylase
LVICYIALCSAIETNINCLSGGLGAAASMRRDGHKVTIYERADYTEEAEASISCAANGTQFLAEAGVDFKGNQVILQKLIQQD